MIGDCAPKLVSLTDDLLFGDIWERPGLSQRDRDPGMRLKVRGE
jgi:4-carboxymuconolactone decarboxylase